MSAQSTGNNLEYTYNYENYIQGYTEQNVSNPLQINLSYDFRNNSFSREVQTGSAVFLLDLIYSLDEFGIPTLLVFGIISNLILSITIRQSELKKVATCCYFFSMGIVDTLYLITMAIPWLSIRIVDIYSKNGFCQLVIYLNFLTTFLASWFTVMMLLERLCSVYRPAFAERYHSAFRTKCYITLVSIFSIVGHLYLTWTSNVTTIRKTNVCTIITEHAADIMVMRKIDTVFSFLIPAILNVSLFGIIVVFMSSPVTFCKDRGVSVHTRMLTVEVRLHDDSERKNSKSVIWSENETRLDEQRLRRFSNNKRLTVSALVIAIVYTLLLLPHNIIKLRLTFTTGEYIMTFKDELFLKLFEEFFKFNFAYKGLVYFTILPEMRSNLLKVFSRCLIKKRQTKKNSKCIETQL